MLNNNHSHSLNSLKKTNVDFFSLSDFYLFFKASNKRISKEVPHDYIGDGDHVIFAKYTLQLPYIFISALTLPIKTLDDKI